MEKKYNRALPLIAGAIIQLCIGIIYIWSVFRVPLTELYSAHVDPNYAASCASLTYSIMLATFVVGIVVGGLINDKKGPKPVVLGGGILFAAGILISAACVSFAPTQPWLVCVFYGGIAGCGVGAAYTSTISCAQKWFMDKRGFATGIIVCTFGASTVVFTPVANSLIKSVGLAQTFLIMSIIFLCVILIFFRFVKNPPEEYMQQFIKSPQTFTQKQYTPKETLRTKQLYMLIISMMLLTPAYFILNPLFKSLGEMRGLTEEMAVFALSITGIASAAGRLCAPWLSDKIGRKPSLILLYVISIAAVLALIGAQGGAYIALILVVTFAFGGSAGVYPAINADYFGTKNAGANYGLIMIGFAASALLFPNIATAINQGGEPTPLTFIIPAIACIAGIVVTVLLKHPHHKDEKTIA